MLISNPIDTSGQKSVRSITQALFILPDYRHKAEGTWINLVGKNLIYGNKDVRNRTCVSLESVNDFYGKHKIRNV